MHLIDKIIYQMLKMLKFYVIYRNKAFFYIKIIYLTIINYYTFIDISEYKNKPTIEGSGILHYTVKQLRGCSKNAL